MTTLLSHEHVQQAECHSPITSVLWWLYAHSAQTFLLHLLFVATFWGVHREEATAGRKMYQELSLQLKTLNSLLRMQVLGHDLGHLLTCSIHDKLLLSRHTMLVVYNGKSLKASDVVHVTEVWKCNKRSTSCTSSTCLEIRHALCVCFNWDKVASAFQGFPTGCFRGPTFFHISIPSFI